MRLRFLWTDHFEEASKTAWQCYQQSQIPVPSSNCCLSIAAECAALLFSWMLPKLLSAMPTHVAVSSLEMQQLCIGFVQDQFLSAVLPRKFVLLRTLSRNDTEGCLLEIDSLAQDNSMREVNLKCKPHFESMALDLPQQNDLVTGVVSEVSSIIGRYFDTCDVKMRYGTFNELDIGGPPSQMKKAFRGTNSSKAEVQKELHGCTHIIAILQCESKHQFPKLEAPMKEELFGFAEFPSLSQEVYMRTVNMGIHFIHMPVADIAEFLQTEFRQLALRLFTLKFSEQSTIYNKIYGQSCKNSHMQLLVVLSHSTASPDFSFRQPLKDLQVFELPLLLWDIKKFSAKCFVKVFDEPHQYGCLQIPTILESYDSNTFETLIVGPELVYKDHSFSSLPVPPLEEGKKTCVAMDAIKEALSEYKHAVPLALDFLYLDWHVSHKKDCGKQSCSALECRLLQIAKFKPMVYLPLCIKVDNAHVGSTEKNSISEVKWSLEKESLVCSPKQSCSLESRESACPPLPDRQVQSPDKTFGNGGQILVRSPNRNTCFSEMEAAVGRKSMQDMFACNDLSFFLHARHGTANADIALTANANIALNDSDGERNAEVKNHSLCCAKDNYHVHNIILNEPILKLRACLELDYLRILQNDNDLAQELENYEALKSLHTEADAKAALILLIKEIAKNQNSVHEQQLLRGLIVLYILQQTVDNLCMYGIQVGHLYMESWYLNLRFLQDLVCCSYAECEEAYRQVEKGALIDHPKLTCLGEILLKHKTKVWSPKFLVIAERRGLFTLYKKIISCNLKPYQFDREENLLQSRSPRTELLNDAVRDAISKCDCLMVPPEYIIESFPTKQFTCIVQYGHLLYNAADLKCGIQNSGLEVHILQIKDNGHSHFVEEKLQQNPEVLQEVQSDYQGGLPVLQNAKQPCVKIQQSLTVKGSTSSNDKSDLELGVVVKPSEGGTDNTSAHICLPTGIFSNYPLTFRQCEMNIVVNINKLHSCLLSGQRSSYQKILAFEKTGMNVVERDLSLPIDIILSPTVCLVWYTKEKLLNVEPGLDQLMPLSYVECLTNDIMKPLSFSFKTFIMVFEGQSEFAVEAMQIFGYLQSAAVGLDIHLQCFISGSSSTTDMIIANCILEMKRLQKANPVPAMLEAEPLAESFLTAFASINALAAHAILSCGIDFCEFIALKIEEQLKVTEPFDLSERSLMLFKLQAQSGSIGGIHKDGKHVCSSDLSTLSKVRKIIPREKKPSSMTEQLLERQQSNPIDIEEHWNPQIGAMKTTLDDDYVAQNVEIPVENDDDGECLKSSLNMKQGANLFDYPLYSEKSPSKKHNKRLKKTIDLILQRNSSSKMKDFQSTFELGNTIKSPEAVNGGRDPLFELDANNSSNPWPYVQVETVSSPNVDSAETFKRERGQANNLWSPCAMGNQNFQKTPHSCPSVPRFSHNADRSRKLHSGVYTTEVCKSAMEMNLEDLFDYDINDNPSQLKKGECPMEFANETREHLKRKLDFESPHARCFTSRAREGHESITPSIFEKFKYEGTEQPHAQKLNSERHSGVDLFNGSQKYPRQDIYPDKFMNFNISNMQRKPNTHARVPNKRPNSHKGPTQLKGLGPSWTPHDKRSKKSLSFARKGNDRQSRLVWESLPDISKKGNPSFPFSR